MSSSRKQRVREAEALLKTHVPPVSYEPDAGLLRLRAAIARQTGAPSWSAHVPVPGRRFVRPWTLALAASAGTCVLLFWLWRGSSEPPPATQPPSAQERSVRPPPGAPSLSAADAGASALPRAARPAPRERAAVGPQRENPRALQAAPMLAPAARLEPTRQRDSLVEDEPEREPPEPLQPSAPAGTPSKKRPAPAAPVPARVVPRHRDSKARGHHAPSTPDDLLEMQQIAQAERQLERAPEQTLLLVREGQLRFRHGYFAEERRYLMVLALFKLGRGDEARAAGWSFLQEFPSSPYAARIAQALRREGPP